VSENIYPKFMRRMDKLTDPKSPTPTGFALRFNWLCGNDVSAQEQMSIRTQERIARFRRHLPNCSSKDCNRRGFDYCDLCDEVFCTEHLVWAIHAGTPEIPLALKLCATCRPAEKYWVKLIDRRVTFEAKAEMAHRTKQGLKRKLSPIDACEARFSRPIVYDRRGKPRRLPQAVLFVGKPQ
jgi:hypothetical protein